MTMPPTKKRNRNLGPSDATDNHFAKATRSDDGGRRLGFAFGSGITAASAEATSSTPKSTIASKSSATRGRKARETKYHYEIAKLNYQIYQWAQRNLRQEIPNDAFYLNAVENYLLHASAIHEKYNRSYGDIVTFGQGDCGQLGCGEAVTEARKPKILANLRGEKIVSVASGGLHSLALKDDGAVASWGCNDEGSLGWRVSEEKDDGALPSEVRGFYPSQFGPNGKTEDILDNGQIIPFEKRNEAVITQIAAGETSSLALSTTGDVYMWGAFRDSEGRKFRSAPPKDDTRVLTGFKDMANLEEDDDPKYYHPPRGNQDWPMHLVQMTDKAKFISAGGHFAAALLENGDLVTFGIGTSGELARPIPTLNKKTPNSVVLEDFLKPKVVVWEQPSSKPTIVTMACGGNHLLVVARGQEGLSVYSSGLNQYGQLGHGDEKNREKLTKIEYLEGHDITKVEGGEHFSCFVDKTGKEVYTCGRGDYGQLGITLEQSGEGYFENVPVRVPLVYEPKGTVSNPKGNSIVPSDIVEEDQPEVEQISCGSTHVLVLTKGGDAYSWGFGTMGACGQGKSEEDVLMPKKLVSKNNFKMKYVSGGGQHSTAVVTTGSAGFSS